jgi:hypothetical protein
VVVDGAVGGTVSPLYRRWRWRGGGRSRGAWGGCGCLPATHGDGSQRYYGAGGEYVTEFICMILFSTPESRGGSECRFVTDR